MTSNHGIDWDGELQTLMESSGIDPTQLTRPTWRTRARRKISNARAALVSIVVAVPLMWLTAYSGAPRAAVLPLLVWLTGWISYGVWISLGRPDWTTAANTARNICTAGFRVGWRFLFTHSRPLRARWRVLWARFTAEPSTAREV